MRMNAPPCPCSWTESGYCRNPQIDALAGLLPHSTALVRAPHIDWLTTMRYAIVRVAIIWVSNSSPTFMPSRAFGGRHHQAMAYGSVAFIGLALYLFVFRRGYGCRDGAARTSSAGCRVAFSCCASADRHIGSLIVSNVSAIPPSWIPITK